MKAVACICLGLLLAAAAANAQPVVLPNGIVNAVSSIQAGLPNGDIAQGSMFSIYGSNMGPATPVSATTWPLQAQQGLGGVTVQVRDSAGQTRFAILLFVYAGQINAVLPSATATGRATVTVTYNGQTSATPQSFNVVASSVGLNTRNARGTGPGLIQQYRGAAAPTFNEISNSAVQGDVGVLWGTGLGPVTDVETQPPTQYPMTVNAEVWVGGQQVPSALINYKGRATAAGQDQINFVIPNIVGCYVPVFVKIGNIVSNTVSMAISTSPGMCSDALSFSGLDASYVQANGIKQGHVSLSHSTVKMSVEGVSLDSTTDSASGSFYGYDWARLAQSHGQVGVSTFGACTVFTFSNQASSADPILPTYLDAGNLSLLGPDGATKQIPSVSKGVYSASLGSSAISIPGLPGTASTLWLLPGNYTLTGAGGADVGAFTSTLTLPQTFVWTNMDATTQVTRASGLPVNWTGGAGVVTIYGYSSISTPQSVGAMFYCVEQAVRGTFTVPAAVLLALPPSAIDSGVPMGFLSVSNQPVTVSFKPSGLDIGDFSASFSFMKMLGYN